MGRSALDMQHHGAFVVRCALAHFMLPGEISPLDKSDDASRPDQFTVTIEGYDYTVTVAFDDPR